MYTYTYTYMYTYHVTLDYVATCAESYTRIRVRGPERLRG